MSNGATAEEVKLNYADKLYAAMERTSTSASRFIAIQTLLSLVVLFLVGGVITTEQQLEFTGIKLTLPLWALLGGMSITIATFSVLAISQLRHAGVLTRELLKLYEELGYQRPTEARSEGVVLSPSVLDSLLREASTGGWAWHSAITGVLVPLGLAVAYFVLPLVAQVAALIRLGGDFGWSWHVWLPLGSALVISATVVVASAVEPDWE